MGDVDFVQFFSVR